MENVWCQGSEIIENLGVVVGEMMVDWFGLCMGVE